MASAQRDLEIKNKEMCLVAYQAIFGDQNLSAIDTYISDNFIEHNPLCKDGKEGVKETVAMFAKGPKKVLEIKRAAAEGDLVWMHVNFPDPDNQGKFLAIVDIFRIENGKIVEHWDVIQPITDELMKEAQNSHPFF